MRILMIVHSHICGGAERHVLFLIQGLSGLGHEVIYAGPCNSWLAEELRKSGIERFHVPMHGFYDPFSICKLLWITLQKKIDLVHGHLVRGTHYASIIKAILKVPCICTAHSTVSYKRFKRADKIIAVSWAVSRFLQSKGIPDYQIRIIYPGIKDLRGQLSGINIFREHMGGASHHVVVGVISRFVPDKGQDIVLRAVHGLKQKNWHLFFIGDHSTPWGIKIVRLVHELKLEKQVTFLGFQNEVAPFLGCLDVLLAPSRREALSLTIMEAMSFGIPVIGSNVGGIPEIVRHGETGLLIPPEDPMALQGALSTLMDRPGWRKKFGLQGRKKFLADLSWPKMVQNHVQLYQERLFPNLEQYLCRMRQISPSQPIRESNCNWL